MPTLKFHEQQKEWAIKAVAGIVTLALCYGVMIHPVFRNIAVSRQRIVDTRKLLELHREVGGLKKSLEGSESALAMLTERSVVLGKIADIASQSKVDVETLTPRTEPDGSYVRLKIEMEGKGSFFSLIKFLKALEKISVPIKVKDIAVLRQASADPRYGKYPLRISLMFETFLKQGVKKTNV